MQIKAADSRHHERFHIRSMAQLEAEIRDLGLDIPISPDLSVLGQPVPVGPLTAPNRFVVQPMEGFDADPDGGPGELAFRRYQRYAAGGFGAIWVEATAVMHEGRSNPNQLYLHQGSADTFKRLVEMMRRTARQHVGRDIVLIIQLTHSGRYSKPDGVPAPIIAHHSPILDPKHQLPGDYPLVTDDYLDALQDRYVEAARLAAAAGFDGIDIKSCHRYLVSELHASFTRDGKYGGSFENRTRLLREAVTRIRQEVPGVFVTTRMNAYDAIAHPYGFGVDRDDYRVPDLEEPIRLARLLADVGAPVLNVSIGNPYFNPHFGRPYDFPIKGMQAPDDHPLAGIDRFLAITARFQQELGALPVVGSGYTWLRQFVPFVAAGVVARGDATLVGLGRSAFAYPDAVRDILENGAMDPKKCCVTCSACTQIMRDGGHTGCVVRDSEIYGPEYRLARRFSLDRLREEARRCRDCEEATCTMGCPAGVDVPAFIRAFADGDIAQSYRVLHAANVLPEMCAYVCPSEVQCEGGCLETIFCENPIPIRDIQLVVSQLARRQGLTGVHLPDEETGRRIAVVGGGPAGVAAAITLLEQGHAVTILEKGGRLGGTPDRVIPADRYGNALGEVDAILQPALAAGRLRTRFGTALGVDVQLDDLRAEYDAVMLAVGLTQSTSLGKGKGVVDALAFLNQIKNGDWGEVPGRVAVLGGGNTAMDAGVTALDHGASDVYLVYRRFNEMPAWPAERDRFVEKGGHCLILNQPLGYEFDESGDLSGVRIARTVLGQPDASGRRRPEIVHGSESVLSVDLVVEAIGQGVSDDLRRALPGIEFQPNGKVCTAAPSSLRTSLDAVYVAGDLVNGGTTAVQGIAEGMRAARELDEALRR